MPEDITPGEVAWRLDHLQATLDGTAAQVGTLRTDMAAWGARLTAAERDIGAMRTTRGARTTTWLGLIVSPLAAVAGAIIMRGLGL